MENGGARFVLVAGHPLAELRWRDGNKWLVKSSNDNTRSDKRRASIIFYLIPTHVDPLSGCESLEESNGGGKNPTVIRG
jgi:hypothetical protein